MKKTVLVIGVIFGLITSCQKENLSNPSNSGNDLSSIDINSALVLQIENEVNKVLTEKTSSSKTIIDPENPNNPYDYAGANFKEAMEIINQNWSEINSKDNVQPFINTYTSFYETKGYSLEEINNTSELISLEMGTFTSVNNFLTEKLNEQKVSLLEKNLYNSYFDELEIEDKNTFILVSKIYEDNIVNSNELSALSKRNLLSVISVIKYSSTMTSPWTDDIISKADLGTICAGNVIVHLVAGAIVGNGLGAVVGLFTGAWANYAAGCFD